MNTGETRIRAQGTGHRLISREPDMIAGPWRVMSSEKSEVQPKKTEQKGNWVSKQAYGEEQTSRNQ